jgi:hypothetical protein
MQSPFDVAVLNILDITLEGELSFCRGIIGGKAGSVLLQHSATLSQFTLCPTKSRSAAFLVAYLAKLTNMQTRFFCQ